MDNTSQLFSLKWNNYLSHIMDAFEMLRSEENLVDVTLSCEGYKIKAHKMLLSACSSYFKDLFKDNPCQHPIVVFRNVKFYDLRALIDFIYQGEVNVKQDHLASFLATAKLLEVKGLTDNSFGSYDGTGNHDSESFEDENVSENIEDEEVDDDENLSDASQYAQSTYPQEVTSGPLTIIPINRNAAELPSEYTTFKKKRKIEIEDEVYQRRSYQQSNTKLMQKVSSNEMSTISFKTKQSVDIFPVPPLIKAEKIDESYLGEVPIKDSRVDRLSECEIQTMAMEPKINVTSMEDNYVKTHMELNHLLTKSSHGAADTDLPQDSLQGHWLSSLNNGADVCENVTNESGVTVANRKPASTDTNVDLSQQRHRYICSICGATYKHLRNLRAHCHLHYGKTRCNLCNKVLCNISYFKKHLQQQHGLLTAKKTDAKNLSSPSLALPST